MLSRDERVELEWVILYVRRVRGVGEGPGASLHECVRTCVWVGMGNAVLSSVAPTPLQG